MSELFLFQSQKQDINRFIEFFDVHLYDQILENLVKEKTHKGTEGLSHEDFKDAVEKVENISEVHSISGQFDLMMKCYLDDDQDIGHFVTEKVQLLPGVKDTFTLITFKAFA